ncbi:MAG: hypothetical protein JXB32_08690 [Deltaproteobacteria bacterium]|nr:hypothetical protein [Deltaproteobacteria bacterium]
MDFPPALAVGDDGSVHLVTRHGGSFDAGHELRYRRRNAAGTWDLDHALGTPVPRNYVVGAAWAGAGSPVLLSSQGGSDVWGTLHLWEEAGGSAAASGDLDGIWRADTDARLRGHGGTVYLVSGRCDPGGTAYFSWGAAGAGLRDRLAANLQEHTAGTGRRGFPDLHVDAAGSVHFLYGAHQEVYYNRYDAAGTRQLAADVRVFDGLGDWHLSTGLGAVAGADDGRTVAAVALRSDGSDTAADSDLLWSVSTDGGATWSAPVDSGRNTNGGEGRRRPRLVALGGTFFVFFWDNEVSALSLATLAVATDADGDGYPSDVDCDDTRADVNPGATEVCGNGIDDDCDGATDEGCGSDADAGDVADAPDDIAPYDDGAVAPDDGTAADVGPVLPVPPDEGCGCRAAGAAPKGAWWSVGSLLVSFLLVVPLRRRRRRARSGEGGSR